MVFMKRDSPGHYKVNKFVNNNIELPFTYFMFLSSKYHIWQTEYDRDSHFCIFRAASIHLYFAEIYARWEFDQGGIIRPDVLQSLAILNDGSYNDNEITGWYDYTGNLLAKQEYLEDQIITERVRELAFEGERFYDLMRIAKRRNDPSYLADKVAAKFKGAKAEQIRNFVMNEENWYIPFY